MSGYNSFYERCFAPKRNGPATAPFASVRSKALKWPPLMRIILAFGSLMGQRSKPFFEHVQRQSVDAVCKRCERPVRLMPTKDVCALCVCAMEYGAPSSISEYGDTEPKTLEPRPPRLAAKDVNE